jgi:hypothetical protein
VATDFGMCCAFNMKAAEDIYKETTYTKRWQKMQNWDKIASGEIFT